MSSIFNTDLGELYNQWGERVAYNKGYEQQKINSAKEAGRDAFDLGVDKGLGRDAYFEARDSLTAAAAGFDVSDSAVSADAEADVDSVVADDPNSAAALWAESNDAASDDARADAEHDEFLAGHGTSSEILQAAEDDEQINENEFISQDNNWSDGHYFGGGLADGFDDEGLRI